VLVQEDAEVQMNGTVAGLLAFLEWASRTGELSSNTAAAYRTAVTKLMEIDGENYQSASVRDIDLDRQLDRFTRLKASGYNAQSLQTYGNRFRAAISSYTRYLQDPANFRKSAARPARSAVADRPKSTEGLQRPGAASRGSAANIGATHTEAAELVQYPFPLRSGVMAYLSLPRDLQRSEAQRIAAFVASLAMEPISDVKFGSEAES
jgi:hypothetical protein